MSGIYHCRIWIDADGVMAEPDTPDARQCGKVLGDDKARRTHEKSHIRRPCRWCGRMVSNNGHTQHQTSCVERPEALQWEVWADLVRDLVAHANELPDDEVCLVSTRRGALIMKTGAAVDAAADAVLVEPVLLIPARLLPKPKRAARWRRRDVDTPRDLIDTQPAEEIRAPMRTPKVDPTALPDVNWDAVQ